MIRTSLNQDMKCIAYVKHMKSEAGRPAQLIPLSSLNRESVVIERIRIG
jgi:hypothetical protein